MMKKTGLLALVAIYFSFCSKKWTQQRMIEYNHFSIVKIDDSTFSLKVRFYDTVSVYESMYQDFMIDRKGKPDGKLIITDESGHTRRVLFHKSEQRIKNDIWLFENGDTMQVTSYIKNIPQHRTAYYKTGIKEFETDWNLGYLTHFDKGGDIIYHEDSKNKISTCFYKNGIKKMEGKGPCWDCLQPYGKWKYYDSAGNMTKIVYFKTHVYDNSDAWDSIQHFQNEKLTRTEKKQN